MSNELQITYIEYSMGTKSIDIFTIGCDANPRCKGCCNPQTWDWNQKGQTVTETLKRVYELNERFDSLIDKFIIVGGDPVDGYIKYPNDVTKLLRELGLLGKPIYLFTRHELDEIPDELKNLVQYIKTGAYIPELTCDDNICEGIKLATSNQKIYKMGE